MRAVVSRHGRHGGEPFEERNVTEPRKKNWTRAGEGPVFPGGGGGMEREIN